MTRLFVRNSFFGLFMAVTMVYGMETYNSILRLGGITAQAFRISVIEIFYLTAIVMALQAFIGGPLAHRIAFRFVRPGTHSPIAVTLGMSIAMVLCMCPLMSFVATVLFKDPRTDLLLKWLRTFGLNLPMAFAWQLLVAGPIVRKVTALAFDR